MYIYRNLKQSQIHRREANILDLVEYTKLSRIYELCDELDRFSIEGPEQDFIETLHTIMAFFASPAMSTMKTGQKIFRARSNLQNEYYDNISSLIYPKREFVTTRGRLNDIGQPLYYAAYYAPTSLLEITQNSFINQPTGYATILQSTISKNDNHHFMILYPESTLSNSKTKNATVDFLLGQIKMVDDFFNNNYHPNIVTKLNVIRSFIADRLTSQNEDCRFDCYKITSGIAKILQEQFHANGFLYPSVRLPNKNACVAYLPHIVDCDFIHLRAYRVYYQYSFTTPGNYDLSGAKITIVTTHRCNQFGKHGEIIWKEYSDNTWYR